MLILAVDPGLRACGVAVHTDGALVWAGLVRNPEERIRGRLAWAQMAAAVRAAYPLMADLLVVEMPQYDGRTAGGAAPDVFEVVGVAGALLCAFYGFADKALAVTPMQWKKSVPKPVMQARLRVSLSSGEWEAVEDPEDHNVLDGVMLARWASLLCVDVSAKDGP